MKCPICGCEETKEINQIKEDYYVVEYDVVCAECEAYICHWAYGTYFYDD